MQNSAKHSKCNVMTVMTPLSGYQIVKIYDGSTAYGIKYNPDKLSNEFWKIDLPSGQETFLEDVTFDNNSWTTGSFTISPTHLSAQGSQGEIHIYSLNTDLDGDGFVDEITNYQLWTATGGVDLTNRRGKTYSDDSSRFWNAVKAVEVDSGFSVLLALRIRYQLLQL